MSPKSQPPRRAGETAKRLYRGEKFSVWRHHATEPGGMRIVRDLVHHPGSAVILPCTTDNRIVLVRQYRLAVRRKLWELPAGTLDAGETPLQAARRELAEETGYTSSRWKKLLDFYPSPGVIAERMTIFVAHDVKAGTASPEDDERIDVRPFTIDQLLRMIKERSIRDAKTWIGVLYWERFGTRRVRRR